MLFLISIFVLSFISFIFPLATIVLSVELIIYFLMSFFFSLKSLKHSNFGLNNLLSHMFTCLILHVSYGHGYVEGVFDFLIINRSPKTNNEKLSR